MSQPRPLLSPPETEEQLLAQAQQLSGYTLGELAALVGLVTPENLKRDKGWIGVLLEIWLGASAGSKPEQDFAALGVELKTIPVDSLGRPLETTFVCVAPLTGNSGVTGKPATCATNSNAYCGYRLKASAASRWRSVALDHRCCGARMKRKTGSYAKTGKN